MLCTQCNLYLNKGQVSQDLKDGFLADLLITRLLMLILYFYLHFFPFYINFITDESRASNHRSSTHSRWGFCRRTGSSCWSRRGFFSWIDSFLDLGRGFSRRAKTRTCTCRVVLSPHPTALAVDKKFFTKHSGRTKYGACTNYSTRPNRRQYQ